MQAHWAELSPHGRQVFVETGHMTWLDDLEAIVEIIARHAGGCPEHTVRDPIFVRSPIRTLDEEFADWR